MPWMKDIHENDHYWTLSPQSFQCNVKEDNDKISTRKTDKALVSLCGNLFYALKGAKINTIPVRQWDIDKAIEDLQRTHKQQSDRQLNPCPSCDSVRQNKKLTNKEINEQMVN